MLLFITGAQSSDYSDKIFTLFLVACVAYVKGDLFNLCYMFWCRKYYLPALTQASLGCICHSSALHSQQKGMAGSLLPSLFTRGGHSLGVGSRAGRMPLKRDASAPAGVSEKRKLVKILMVNARMVNTEWWSEIFPLPNDAIVCHLWWCITIVHTYVQWKCLTL